MVRFNSKQNSDDHEMQRETMQTTLSNAHEIAIVLYKNKSFLHFANTMHPKSLEYAEKSFETENKTQQLQ